MGGATPPSRFFLFLFSEYLERNFRKGVVLLLSVLPFFVVLISGSFHVKRTLGAFVWGCFRCATSRFFSGATIAPLRGKER